MLHFGRKQAHSPFGATVAISVRKVESSLVSLSLNITYRCFIRLKFVTETDILRCSKDNAVVYAKQPLRNSAALVTSCVWLYIKSKNT